MSALEISQEVLYVEKNFRFFPIYHHEEQTKLSMWHRGLIILLPRIFLSLWNKGTYLYIQHANSSFPVLMFLKLKKKMHVWIKEEILPGTLNHWEIKVAIIKTSSFSPQKCSKQQSPWKPGCSTASIFFQGQLWIKSRIFINRFL